MKTKDLPESSGIYTLENVENGRKFIAYTINFKQAVLDHFRRLNKDRHKNSSLQEDWNTYAPYNFIVNIVEYVEDKTLMLQKYKDLILITPDCYNVNNNPVAPPRRFLKARKKVRWKISPEDLIYGDYGDF